MAMAQKMRVGEILLSEEQIKNKVKELAAQISRDYPKNERLLVVGILKGCFVFISDLVRELDMDVEVQFMQVSSYGSGMESGGNIHIKKDLDVDIKGRNVLIAEDIVDSGNTLSKLVSFLQKRNPASVKVCALLSKPDRRQVEFEADYTGFEIPDKYIVGYGLDLDESYRNLPYIAVMEPEE